jgi:hypothetical protein
VSSASSASSGDGEEEDDDAVGEDGEDEEEEPRLGLSRLSRDREVNSIVFIAWRSLLYRCNGTTDRSFVSCMMRL